MCLIGLCRHSADHSINVPHGSLEPVVMPRQLCDGRKAYCESFSGKVVKVRQGVPGPSGHRFQLQVLLSG